METSKVVLVLRNKLIDTDIENIMQDIQYTDEKISRGGSTLFYWGSVEWVEDVGTPEYKLVSKLEEADQADFLLLRTWGNESVDISGCFWNNPFKVVITRTIDFDDSEPESNEKPKSPPGPPKRITNLSTIRSLSEDVYPRLGDDDNIVLLLHIIRDAIDGVVFDHDSWSDDALNDVYESLSSTFKADDPIWSIFTWRPDEDEEDEEDEEDQGSE